MRWPRRIRVYEDEDGYLMVAWVYMPADADERIYVLQPKPRAKRAKRKPKGKR